MIRIGHSTDIHRLEEGKRLILGGIEILSSLSAVGHSDADCLLHAIAEAMLGALALGDLGTLYPDTDDRYRDFDSKIILTEVHRLIKAKGYKVLNIDTMVFLEQPKLLTYKLAMRESIAQVLDVDIDQVSIKATTGETIGIVGRSEAIVCEAVVLLEK